MRDNFRKSQLVIAAWFALVSLAIAEPVISTLTGSSSNRVDVVFLGDGYQASELDVYESHVENAIDYMFRGTEEPFNRYQNFFNFHRIEVTSAESGADIAPPSTRGTITGIMDRADNLAPNVIEFYSDSPLPPQTTFTLEQYLPDSTTPVSNRLTLPDGLQAGSFAYIFSDNTTSAEFDGWFGANSTGSATVFSGTYGQGGLNSTFVLRDVGGVAIDAYGTAGVPNEPSDWVYRESLTRPSASFVPTEFEVSEADAFAGSMSNEEVGANQFPRETYIAPDSLFVDTALDSRFYFDGVTERLLSVDSNKAFAVESRSLEFEAEMRFAVINSEKFGGAGGAFATFSGGNPLSSEIALHEIAHSFAGLADEYESFSAVYPNGEPVEPNVTIDPDGAKWAQWIGYEQEGIGTIGVYEGARYYTDGIYRPSVNSKMRELLQPFDAVSREQLVLEIYEFVDPIDSHTPNINDLGGSVDLAFSDEVSVEVVDPNVIDTTWLVNDEPIDYEGSTLPISEFFAQRIAPGVHDLTVIATDNTDWIRLESQRPTQAVTWTVRYFPGDFNGNELTDAPDIDALTAAAMDPNNNESLFDLTMDGLVDQADRDRWVAANRTLYGDSNLDGVVEFADFLVLSREFGSDATSWASGNFDGVAGIQFADFLMLSENFGLSVAAASVPEPSSHLAMLCVFAILLQLRKRRF